MMPAIQLPPAAPSMFGNMDSIITHSNMFTNVIKKKKKKTYPLTPCFCDDALFKLGQSECLSQSIWNIKGFQWDTQAKSL